jgi:hypothetical protein
MNQKLKYAPHMERIAREQKILAAVVVVIWAAVVVAIWVGLAYLAIVQWLGG